MTATRTDLAGLLMQSARRGAPEAAAPDVEDFDWSRPCFFTAGQLDQIQQFLQEVVETASGELALLMGVSPGLTVPGFSQHHGDQARGMAVASTDCLVGLELAGRAVGVAAIDAATVGDWVMELLGGGETSGEPRALSAMELSIALDLLTAAVAGLNKPLQQRGAKELFTAGEPVMGEFAWPEQAMGRYCRINLLREPGDTRAPVWMLLEASVLDPVCNAGGAMAEFVSDAECRKRIEQVLGLAPCSLKARLGQLRLRAGEAIGLEPGDVLLLGRKIAQPVDLCLGRRVLMAGPPVQCEGSLAIRIEQMAAPGAAGVKPGKDK